MVDLFPWSTHLKILKDKCCIQYVSKFGKLSSDHGIGKGQVFVSIPKKGNAKECSNCCITAFISYTSEVVLKILQARLQQNVNQKLPEIQPGFIKGRETRDQIANIHWIIEKAKEFQKNIYCYIFGYAKAFDWITTNCWKLLKRWEYQTSLLVSWEICNVCRSRSNS